MTLSIDGQPGDVSRRVTYLSARSPAKSDPRVGKAKRADDPWAHRTEGQVADLKRRIPILKRLIADCDRLADDLDREVRNEEDRVKIHDPAHSAYSIYARATASRRDNLRRSANELRAHLARAEKALIKLGEATLDARPPSIIALQSRVDTCVGCRQSTIQSRRSLKGKPAIR